MRSKNFGGLRILWHVSENSDYIFVFGWLKRFGYVSLTLLGVGVQQGQPIKSDPASSFVRLKIDSINGVHAKMVVGLLSRRKPLVCIVLPPYGV